MILFSFCSVWDFVFVKFLKGKGAEDFLPWEFFAEYSKLGMGFLGGGGGGGGGSGVQKAGWGQTHPLFTCIYIIAFLFTVVQVVRFEISVITSWKFHSHNIQSDEII